MVFLPCCTLPRLHYIWCRMTNRWPSLRLLSSGERDSLWLLSAFSSLGHCFKLKCYRIAVLHGEAEYVMAAHFLRFCGYYSYCACDFRKQVTQKWRLLLFTHPSLLPLCCSKPSLLCFFYGEKRQQAQYTCHFIWSCDYCAVFLDIWSHVILCDI